MPSLAKIPNWHEYFLMLSYVVALRSKDDSTKIGAVIVGPDNEIRTTGYNSFPRKISDFVDERKKAPEKYFWLEHAERNAIYNAARMGLSLKSCRLYTQLVPCMDCARGIVQSGIEQVIVDNKAMALFRKHKLSGSAGSADWGSHFIRTEKIFAEANIDLLYIDVDFDAFLPIAFYLRGSAQPLSDMPTFD